jgi:AcrR family transcriptional regulator
MIGTRYDAILAAAADVIARRGFHQASIRDIAHAARLSLAGLYHYVHGKEELLFLVLDRALDRLLADFDRAQASAQTPEQQLRALVGTHLTFAFEEPSALKIINRDWDLLRGANRTEVVAKRSAYLGRGIAVLRALDPHGRTADELYSATNLLLGMLNGIATRPVVRVSARCTAGSACRAMPPTARARRRWRGSRGASPPSGRATASRSTASRRATSTPICPAQRWPMRAPASGSFPGCRRAASGSRKRSPRWSCTSPDPARTS